VWRGDGIADHHWNCVGHPFQAHRGEANAVSWWQPAASDRPLGLSGARMASAGDDGVSVWRWDGGTWCREAQDAGAPGTRDVAWKPWDGKQEMLAAAVDESVAFWLEGESGWSISQRIQIGRPVFRVQWLEMGNLLLLSCGGGCEATILMKQRLSGEWDIMDVDET